VKCSVGKRGKWGAMGRVYMGGKVVRSEGKKVTPKKAYVALRVREVKAPGFLDNRHIKVVRLSALRTGRIYPQEYPESTWAHGLVVCLGKKSPVTRPGIDPRTFRLVKFYCWQNSVVRGSSVGTATHYGLDGPGFELLWGWRDISHPSIQTLGPTQPPVQTVPRLSRG
jgi:hypothetical protein